MLASCYSGLDLFVFPSRFDTFGNVILESFVHGMPAIAYNCKGPKDIIQHKKSGLLVSDTQNMSEQIAAYFQESDAYRQSMSIQSIQRSADYRAQPIMDKFISDLGLSIEEEAAMDTVVNI